MVNGHVLVPSRYVITTSSDRNREKTPLVRCNSSATSKFIVLGTHEERWVYPRNHYLFSHTTATHLKWCNRVGLFHHVSRLCFFFAGRKVVLNTIVRDDVQPEERSKPLTGRFLLLYGILLTIPKEVECVTHVIRCGEENCNVNKILKKCDMFPETCAWCSYSWKIRRFWRKPHATTLRIHRR